VKAAALILLVALCAGRVAYEHLWLHGGAQPLHYRYASLHGFEPARPLSKASVSDGLEHVLVSPGPRSSSGYSLDVVKAEVERGRVLIVVRERSPTLEHPGRPGVTYPYRLLVFPNPHKPVHVGWEESP
jgi:protease stability complex PrcB-like protein